MSNNTEEIYSVLTRIGYNLRDFGKEYRTMPLYRASGNSMSIAINKHNGEWYDFSAKIGGNIEYLVKLTLNLTSMDEAKKFFNSEKQLNLTPVAPDIEQPRIFNKALLIKLKKDHSYWVGRNIPEEVVEIFGGGTTQNGKMANRYVFPIFDLKDNLVGFDGRYLKEIWGDVPKWKIIGDKSHWIYPYKYNSDVLMNKKEVILVESIGDMLSLWAAGIKNVLVVFGVEVSDALLNFLIKLNPNKIIISFNNDADNNFVGNESAEKARNKICGFFDLGQVEIKLPFKNDFNVMTPEEIIGWSKNVKKQSESLIVNMKRKEAYDVYIGRTKQEKFHYGNPFDFQGGIGMVPVANREEAIYEFEEWLRGNPKWFGVESERREWILKNICSLEGKRLGCFCKPLKCHGDVLLKLLHENCK